MMAELAIRMKNRGIALGAFLDELHAAKDTVELTFPHVREIPTLGTHTIGVVGSGGGHLT
ncbi:MAG TPA: hypothetical protein VNN76_07165 [Bacteroidota bacterium]|nr:hypothetical protein [Bacteroidota bacterium]